MGVSTVTISIEEFEDLISSKRKLKRIRQLKDWNTETIRETNKLAKESIICGDMKALEALVTEQDKKNLIYMAKIMEVLESEDK